MRSGSFGYRENGGSKVTKASLQEGIFSMDFISTLQHQPLDIAKQVCLERIDNSTATPENKMKAQQAVTKAASLKNLLLTTSNFSLAHQGMKVL
jgi:hypothetical protein